MYIIYYINTFDLRAKIEYYKRNLRLSTIYISNIVFGIAVTK